MNLMPIKRWMELSQSKTSTFEWKLADIRIKKITSAPISGKKIVLEVLALLDVRHCPKLQSCAISRKYNNFGPSLAPPKLFPWVLPLLVVRQCSKLSSYAISRKTNGPNLKKWQKTQFWTRFWPIWPKFGPPNFFCRFCHRLVIRHCSKLSSNAIIEEN